MRERQLIEARNEADTILQATEKTLQREDALAIPARRAQRHRCRCVAQLRAAVAGNDYKLIRARMDEAEPGHHCRWPNG